MHPNPSSFAGIYLVRLAVGAGWRAAPWRAAQGRRTAGCRRTRSTATRSQEGPPISGRPSWSVRFGELGRKGRARYASPARALRRAVRRWGASPFRPALRTKVVAARTLQRCRLRLGELSRSRHPRATTTVWNLRAILGANANARLTRSRFLGKKLFRRANYSSVQRLRARLRPRLGPRKRM